MWGTEVDVSKRSWLAASKWVNDAAPFPGDAFRGTWGISTNRNGSSKARGLARVDGALLGVFTACFATAEAARPILQ